MQTGQDKIYYVVGESFAAARSHPAIEGLRARNVEVLLLGRRIDAWVMDHLQDFEGKKFKDATRGDLDLGGLASAADKEKAEAQLKESKPLLKRVKDALGDRISEARVSTRLKDSAAVLVAGEHDISAPLRRALEAAGQQAPAGKPVLELNVDHHLVKYLEHREEAAEFNELALVIYEQAMLAEGAAASRSGRVRSAAQSPVDALAVEIVCNNAALAIPESRDARQVTGQFVDDDLDRTGHRGLQQERETGKRGGTSSARAGRCPAPRPTGTETMPMTEDRPHTRYRRRDQSRPDRAGALHRLAVRRRRAREQRQTIRQLGGWRTLRFSARRRPR